MDLGKRFLLKVALDAVKKVSTAGDPNSFYYANKPMVTTRMSFGHDGSLEEAKLTQELHKIISSNKILKYLTNSL